VGGVEDERGWVSAERQEGDLDQRRPVHAEVGREREGVERGGRAGKREGHLDDADGRGRRQAVKYTLEWRLTAAAVD
jgi:hypothetical protein